MFDTTKSVGADVSSGNAYLDVNFDYATSEASSLQFGITGLAGSGGAGGAARMAFQMTF